MKLLILSLLLVAASASPLLDIDFGQEFEDYLEDGKWKSTPEPQESTRPTPPELHESTRPTPPEHQESTRPTPPEPSSEGPGGEGGFGPLHKVEKLMKLVIDNVHPNEKGFVPHEEIEKPGGELIKLAIEAIKQVKTVAPLVMKDIEVCHRKLEKAFKEGKQSYIEWQAGQCFFVIHRPFIVLLKQAFEQGLFDELGGKDDDRVKRGAEGLARDLKEINRALRRFSDGKIDLPYIIKGLRLVKEASEVAKEAVSIAKLIIGDYIELGQKLLYLLHHDDIDGAQVVAGRFYLSYIRRGMKIGAVLKHLSGDHDRHDHHEHHHEGPHGPTTGPYSSENHEGPPKRLDFEDFVAEDAIQDFEKGY